MRAGNELLEDVAKSPSVGKKRPDQDKPGSKESPSGQPPVLDA